MIDYRGFHPKLLNAPEFSHLKLLLFWPIYGIAFYTLELGLPGRVYFPIESVLDAYIPFCELFLIPYMFWFAYLVGMVVYGCLFDLNSFRRYMYFIMITYTVTIVLYMLFPTCQNLRPAVFERDNALTRFVAGFYAYDTNTNVCPSIHVLGSVAVSYGAWNSKHFGTPAWRWAFSITTALIIVSTVFMKQHSIIDVLAALLLCVAVLPTCRRLEQAQTAKLKKQKLKA